MALYRKYRPRTFAEVIGQEHVTEPLTQALRSGRLHHAYLFSGPRGCGKTSSARILARSLNCEQGPTPEPCGVCGSCRSLANDGTGSIDVIEIDAASHGGVDDARELRERAFFAPVGSRYKIYVIDEAHMVSTQGFNALLKLVEEPPEYVKFVFATTEPDKVLGTIRSRTHHYPFRLIPPAVLRPYLEQLCQAEGVHVDPLVLPLVVRAGAGSARDSLSVLDQLIAGAGPEGVSYARAVALLGVTDAALIDEMCDALAAGDGAAAFATIDRVAEAGHDPRRFASDLLERLRDLIILQQVPDAVAKGLIDGPADQIERMSAQARRMGPATLSRCADIVHTGLVEMRGTTGPRLLLELVCARMLLPGAEDSAGGLLQRLERLERRLTLSGGAAPDQDQIVRAAPVPAASQAPAAPPSPPPSAQSAPAAAAARDGAGAASPGRDTSGPPVTVPDTTEVAPDRRPVPAGAVMPDPVTPEPERPGSAAPVTLDAAAVRRVWEEVLGVVGRRSKRAAALAREATVRDVDGQTLVLTFKHGVHASMFTASPDLLVEAIGEVLGGRWEIRCEVAGDRRSPAGTAPDADQPKVPGAAGPGGARGAATGSGAAPARPAARPAPAQPSPAPGAHHGGGNGQPGQAAPGGGRERQAQSGRHGSPPVARRPSAGRRPEGRQEPGEQGKDDGWPETARPGGVTPPPPPRRDHEVRAENGGAEGPNSMISRPGVGAPAVATAPAASGAWDDGPPPDEPPFDPEYDGFDPGDEPLDDGVAGGPTNHQSSEEQALRLLQERLGAEEITGP